MHCMPLARLRVRVGGGRDWDLGKKQNKGYEGIEQQRGHQRGHLHLARQEGKRDGDRRQDGAEHE